VRVSRSRYALLAFLYALLILYSSTIVGVVGPHFVRIDQAEALRRFLHTSYVAHGSDQRADWMGNLVLLVPFGFLVTGCLSSSRLAGERSGSVPSLSRVAASGAFVLCLVFILAVKYAQMFFPPRTVTINYVVAQALGAGIGIALFGAMRSPLAGIGHGLSRLEGLRIVLRVYTGIIIVFMLMPLDFALSLEDIATQFDKLPDTFTSFPGEGRPTVVRVALVLGSIVAAAPLGALLALRNHGRVHVGRSVSAAAWGGFFLMFAIYAANTMVLSGSASLPAVFVRTIGIALGAWLMHWMTRQDPDEIHRELGDLVPWAVPFYLFAVFAVNGLLSLDWIGPAMAARNLHELDLLPLFNYYIVTKAQAAKNIAGHIAIYAPIGVMAWFRARDGDGRAAAFVLAAILSALVEAGRFLRPGLLPDVNAVPLAGFAAWGTAAFMPLLWNMASAAALGRALTVSLPLTRDARAVPTMDWRERGLERRTRRRERDSQPTGVASGDVEHY
jgi:hypothetical protein